MKVEEVDEALIEGVCSRIREQLPADDAELAEAFVRQYYRWVSPEDLEERTATDLFGAALAHFELAKQRKPNEPSVRVYNPTAQNDGWVSTHTVVVYPGTPPECVIQVESSWRLAHQEMPQASVQSSPAR